MLTAVSGTTLAVSYLRYRYSHVADIEKLFNSDITATLDTPRTIWLGSPYFFISYFIQEARRNILNHIALVETAIFPFLRHRSAVLMYLFHEICSAFISIDFIMLALKLGHEDFTCNTAWIDCFKQRRRKICMWWMRSYWHKHRQWLVDLSTSRLSCNVRARKHFQCQRNWPVL